MTFDVSRPRVLVLVVLALTLAAIPIALSWLGASYGFRVAHTAIILVMLSVSLSYVAGTGGMLSFAHAAFYGIGAYTAAVFSVRLGMPWPVGLVVGTVLAGFVGAIGALPLLRLTSIYFAVATIGLAEIALVIARDWESVTNGVMGFRGIQPFRAFGLDLSSPLGTYYLLMLLGLAFIWVFHRLTHSYFGNALRAVREDVDCARAMGIPVTRVKVAAFAIGSAGAGFAGACMAHTSGYISTENFTVLESALVLTCVVIGGLGSVPGAVFGAIVLLLLTEATRAFGNYRIIVYGVVLFLTILFLPRGVISEIRALRWVRGLGNHRGWA